jgi:CheY-like chemotaxis protein
MATIVVAEDDLHILRVVNIWLRRNQHTVIEAANGRDALEQVRQCKPEMLITDVNMPVMDGIELVKACADEGLLTVGAIVLTSRCDQKEIRDQLKDCVVVLHPKPFSPSRLITEVEELLASAGGGPQPVVQTTEGERCE